MYFLQYKSNFDLLTPHVFGKYKSSFKNDYQTLVKYNVDETNSSVLNKEITKDNFFVSITNIFIQFNNLVINATPTLVCHNFDQLDEFVSNITDPSKMQNFMGVDKNFFEFDHICSINTIHASYKKALTLNKQANSNSDEIRELRAQIELLKQNQTNQTSINSNNNNRTFPSSFDQAHKLFKEEFVKKAKNENHINMFQLHLQNQTVPPSLLWNRFPNAWLPFDESFVNEWNEAIKEFQTKALNLCLKYSKLRVESNESKIIEMKNKYNDTLDIDTKLKKISDDVYKSLEKSFLDKINKIKEYTPLTLRVCLRNSHDSNSFNEGNNSFNSQRSNSYKRNSNNDSHNNSQNNSNYTRNHKRQRRSNGNHQPNLTNRNSNNNNNRTNQSTPNNNNSNNNRSQRQAQHHHTRFQNNSYHQN
jgi:hypothetical protein